MIALLSILVYIFYAYCLSILLERSGQTGWWAFIPILNFVGLLRAVKMSSWLVIVAIIPVVNLILHVIVWLKVAHNFKHGTGFAVGLILLPVIFLPLLAWPLRPSDVNV
jgi:hypothetical protein